MNGTFVKINGTEYPAFVAGTLNDYDWDNRASETIYTEAFTFEQLLETFVDNVAWSIVCYNEEEDPDTHETVTIREEFDYSDYCFAGATTDYRDGRVSVKMGKETDVEELLELLYGGED